MSLIIVLYVAACPRFRASEDASLRAISGSRPSAGMLTPSAAVTYSRAISCAASTSMSTASGQPPRQAASTSPTVSRSATHGVNSPANKPSRLTCPVDSPDSNKLMGLMRTRPIRPAPLCAGPCSPWRVAGVEDPVSMNAPRVPRARSTSWRTQSQMAGTRCHSSIT